MYKKIIYLSFITAFSSNAFTQNSDDAYRKPLKQVLKPSKPYYRRQINLSGKQFRQVIYALAYSVVGLMAFLQLRLTLL